VYYGIQMPDCFFPHFRHFIFTLYDRMERIVSIQGEKGTGVFHYRKFITEPFMQQGMDAVDNRMLVTFLKIDISPSPQ
jgi:hypothetical protein